MMFLCDKCGLCCRNLNLSEIYADLDRGDGTCKYLQGNLCSIYEKRPLKCRVDERYHVYFQSIMTREEYEKLNRDMCNLLKKQKEK